MSTTKAFLGHFSAAALRILLLLSLATVTGIPCFAVVCEGSQPMLCTFTASPNPIIVTDGSGLGVTTISWSTFNYNIPLSLWVNGTQLFCSVGPSSYGGVYFNNGSCTTGKWVTNGMSFVLKDLGGRALASVTVSVVASGGSTPGGSPGCPRSACNSACSSAYSACLAAATTTQTACLAAADPSQCINEAMVNQLDCQNACWYSTGGGQYLNACYAGCDQAEQASEAYCNSSSAQVKNGCYAMYNTQSAACSAQQSSCNQTCNLCPN